MDSLRAPPDLHLPSRAPAACAVRVVITDAVHSERPIINANPAFEHLSGSDDDELLGRTCCFLQGQDRNPTGQYELQWALREGLEATVIPRNDRKDGSLFYNELTVSPVHDASGTLTHYVGFQNDVTKREEARQAQVRLQHQLTSTLQRVTDRCAQGAAWIREGHPDLRMAVNVSALQFESPTFVETVDRCLQETGFPAAQLELELTERMVMRNAEDPVAQMKRLRDLGVAITIDDFGTGYSCCVFDLQAHSAPLPRRSS